MLSLQSSVEIIAICTVIELPLALDARFGR